MSPFLPSGQLAIGYWVCAAAFLMAGVWSAVSPLRRTRRGLIVLGCLLTAAWAGAMAPGDGAWAAQVLEFARDAAWIAFLLIMPGVLHLAKRMTWRSWGVLLAASAGGGIAFFLLAGKSSHGAGISAGLLLSVFALVLIENLYRNCETDGRWGIKAFCLGLGLVFAFDFVLYADALFAGSADAAFLEARGFVDALAVPLILLSVHRSGRWHTDISLSRAVVFHSAVLLGGGLYLLGMAALGMALHLIGGSPAVQMVFLIATVLAMLVLVSSQSFRSAMRVSISKHFFSQKYDYRDVWLKFIRDIALPGQGRDLPHRILHAVADIFNCPSGALWVLQPDEGLFVASARWNFGDDLPSEPADGPLARYLFESRWIIDLADYRRSRIPDVTLPSWLVVHSQAWLLAPLIHNGRLQAFIVLGPPRAAMDITWEDLDLLRTIGEQAGSYLAEEQSLRRLVEASRLEEFNRWSAFLVHDIKGVVGQMSLLVANADQHAHDHAFQRDVVATVANSVQRMRKMLEQLNTRRMGAGAVKTRIDMAVLLRQVGDKWRQSIPSLRTPALVGPMVVEAREDALISILDHLTPRARRDRFRSICASRAMTGCWRSATTDPAWSPASSAKNSSCP
jgi:putative PEP-CTERM system histidine kinase